MPQFDVHAHRHELKQLRDSGETQLYAARSELSCPACQQPFSRLFVTRKETTSFPENDGSRFCLLRNDDAVLLFRH